jgi:hypothetical protein
MAVTAVLVLCVSSAANAGVVGPLGQIFPGANPVLHPSIFDLNGNVYPWLDYYYADGRPGDTATRAQAGSNGHHPISNPFSAYYYAAEVFGFSAGRYPFHLAPGSSGRIPIRSGDGSRCWGSLGGGNLGWVSCASTQIQALEAKRTLHSFSDLGAVPAQAQGSTPRSGSGRRACSGSRDNPAESGKCATAVRRARGQMKQA